MHQTTDICWGYGLQVYRRKNNGLELAFAEPPQSNAAQSPSWHLKQLVPGKSQKSVASELSVRNQSIVILSILNSYILDIMTINNFMKLKKLASQDPRSAASDSKPPSSASVTIWSSRVSSVSGWYSEHREDRPPPAWPHRGSTVGPRVDPAPEILPRC